MTKKIMTPVIHLPTSSAEKTFIATGMSCSVTRLAFMTLGVNCDHNIN